ncbi:Global transcription regulator sge1 [Dispira simplex]|nr:Global transcription regulator sge1 [Dispira simplex]
MHSMSLEHLNPEREAGETFYGFVENSKDAILLIQACIDEKLPRAKRRYTECEKRNIRSGTVIVFDEQESGIRRWTDGKSWSPSRIMGNFLIYRELVDKIPPSKMQEYETPHSSNYALSIQPNDEPQGESGMLGEGEGVAGRERQSGGGTSNGNPALEPVRFLGLTSSNMEGPTLHEPFGRLIQTVTPRYPMLAAGTTSTQRKPLPHYEDTFVYHGNKGIFFVKKGGLVKKTFSMRRRDQSVMHLVSYYTETHLAEKTPHVKTPKDLFSLQDVNFDPEILGNQQFRRTVRLILEGNRVMDLVETVDEAQKSAGGSLFYTTTSSTLPYPVNSLNPLLNLSSEVSGAWDGLQYQDSTSGGHHFSPGGANSLFGQFVYADMNYPTAAAQGHPLPSWSDSYPELTGQDVNVQYQRGQDTVTLLDSLPSPTPAGSLAPMTLANILHPSYTTTASSSSTSPGYPDPSRESDASYSELSMHLPHFPISRGDGVVGAPTPHQASFSTGTNVSTQPHISSSSSAATATEEFEYTSDVAHLFHYPPSYPYPHDDDSTANPSTQPWTPTEGVIPEGRFYPPFFPFSPTGREGGIEGQPAYLLPHPPGDESHYSHHHFLPQHELPSPVATPVELVPMAETSGEAYVDPDSNDNRDDILGEGIPGGYHLLHTREPVVTALPASNALLTSRGMSPADAKPFPSDQGIKEGEAVELSQEPRSNIVNHTSNPSTSTSTLTEETSNCSWYCPDHKSSRSTSTTTSSQGEPFAQQSFLGSPNGPVIHRGVPLSHPSIASAIPGDAPNSASPCFSPGSPSARVPWHLNTSRIPSYHWHTTDIHESAHHQPYQKTDHGRDVPRDQPSLHDTYHHIPPSSPSALNPTLTNGESHQSYQLTPCKRARTGEYDNGNEDDGRTSTVSVDVSDSEEENNIAPKEFVTSPLSLPSVTLLTPPLGHESRQNCPGLIPRSSTP